MQKCAEINSKNSFKTQKLTSAKQVKKGLTKDPTENQYNFSKYKGMVK